MGKYKKYKNIVERFLASDNGTRFFHIAYNLGAAVVILGALFKMLHLSIGNVVLSIGMGVEVFMFCLSALEKPAKDYDWEDVFPVLKSRNPDDRPNFNVADGQLSSANAVAAPVANGGTFSNSMPRNSFTDYSQVTPQTVGQVMGIPSNLNLGEDDAQSLADSIKKLSEAATHLSRMGDLTEATQHYFEQLSSISQQMQQFGSVTKSLTDVSNELLNSYGAMAGNPDEASNSAQGYANQMESLNRNLRGLNTIYEIQLKSVSSQVDTIDRVNTGLNHMKDMYEHSMNDSYRYRQETEKLTKHLSQINAVYERMLEAMTVNMQRTTPPQL